MTSRARIKTVAHALLRIGLGGMFIVAGVLKMKDVGAFVTQIGNYQFLPAWSAYFGIVIPAIEVVVGAAIILSPKLWRQAAELILLVMLVAFTVAVSRAWALGINIECGCFGTGSTPIGPWVLARNLSLITATSVLLLTELSPLRKRQLA